MFWNPNFVFNICIDFIHLNRYTIKITITVEQKNEGWVKACWWGEQGRKAEKYTYGSYKTLTMCRSDLN